MLFNPFKRKVKEPATESKERNDFGVNILHEPPAGTPSDSIVDIVAVHGLMGHAYDTWTDKATGKLWLQDFLPTSDCIDKIPNARIMTFGYDADVTSRNVLDIMGFAENLVAGLKSHRRKPVGEKRPLILIGHSMGGLVIKNALLNARDQEDPLYDATHGIMFMGVPHRGAPGADYATMVTSIAHLATPLSTNALNQLRKDSKDLLNLSIRFGNIQESLMFVTVMEGESTKLSSWVGRGSLLIVPADSARLNLGGKREQTFSISGADHRSVCKFSRDNDPQFIQVANSLADLVDGALKRQISLEPSPAPASAPAPAPVPPPNPVPVAPPNPQALATWPVLVVPFSQNKDVVIRQKLFNQLEEKMRNYRVAALWGLGGTGKTQIVLEYAYRQFELHDTSIFWVNAGSTARFVQDYGNIAIKAGLSSELKGEELLEAVRQWLESKSNWLLILDNADKLDLFEVTTQRAHPSLETARAPGLVRFVPSERHGSILYTSRDESIRGRLVGLKQTINANVLEEKDALALLRNLGDLDDLADHVQEQKRLIDTLQRLPLAIAQAAAYLRQFPEVPILSYVDKMVESENQNSHLLDMGFPDRFRDAKVPNSVMQTWLISMKQVAEVSADAGNLLNIAAYFDSQGIPFELMHHAIGAERDEEDVRICIGHLKRFSFLQVQQSEGKFLRGYQLHSLVAMAARRCLDENQRLHWAGRALKVLADIFPPDWTGKDWLRCREYLPHALKVTNWLGEEHYDVVSEERALLLRKIAAHYMYDNQLDAAEDYATQAVNLYKDKRLGMDNLQYWDSRRKFVLLALRRGHYSKAEKVSGEVLEGRKALVGEGHPDVIESMADTADVLFHQGFWDKAGELYEVILELRRVKFGETHSDTLETMHNMVNNYYVQGRFAEAEALCSRVLDARKSTLGQDHPDTLSAMGNLAAIYGKQQRWQESEDIERRVLKTMRAALGERHPDTLRAMANLAVGLGTQKRWEEEQKIEVEVLELRRQTLGPKHPGTLHAMSNLAITLGHLEKWDDGLVMAKEVLELTRDTLGEKHPDTIHAMASVAVALTRLKQWDEAERLMVRALELRRASVGDTHPKTIHNMSDLAAIYTHLRRWDDAERLMGLVVRLRTDELGATDPKTLRSMVSQADALVHCKRWAEAEAVVDRGLRLADEAGLAADNNTRTLLNKVKNACHKHNEKQAATSAATDPWVPRSSAAQNGTPASARTSRKPRWLEKRLTGDK